MERHMRSSRNRLRPLLPAIAAALHRFWFEWSWHLRTSFRRRQILEVAGLAYPGSKVPMRDDSAGGDRVAIDRFRLGTIRFWAPVLVAPFALWAMVGNASAKTINGCVIKNHSSCARTSLSHKNLKGAHLEYANLSHANLSHADLSGADLRFANLADANLTDARLTGARLGGTKMSGAVLSGTTTGRISGVPAHLPSGWNLTRGYLLERLAIPGFTLTPGPGSLVIKFTANAHARSYLAQVCDSLNPSCRPAQVVHAGSVLSGLTGGTPYRVALTALGDGTHFSNSSVAYRTATAAAATPLATPSFSLSPGSVWLTINAFAAVPNASNYSYQVCDAAGNNCAAAVSVPTSGTTITPLTGGTTYTITLTAVGDGTAFANSATVSQTGTPGSTQLATPALSVTPDPGALTINAFAAVPNASNYSYEVCDAAGNNCAAPVSVPTSGTKITHLTPGKTYTIKLTAVGDGVVYANSVPASVTSTPVASTF
jgi:hypothetical protein